MCDDPVPDVAYGLGAIMLLVLLAPENFGTEGPRLTGFVIELDE